MKKIMFAAATAMLFLINGCTESPGEGDPTSGKNELIDLSVSFSDIPLTLDTRAFMDDISQTEEWERQINSLSVYVYDSEGKYVTHKTFSGTSLGTRCIVSVPRSVAETECTIYAMANITSYNEKKESDFRNTLCSTDIRKFNGNIEQMLSGELFDTGFPMSGYTKKVMSPFGHMTFVHVELKRVMAKVAFEYRVDPDFSVNHHGAAVRIDEVRCGLIAERAYMFETGEVRNGQDNHSVWMIQPSLVDGAWSRNLWYLYERGIQAQGNSNDGEMEFYLTGTFDLDGNFDTTTDQHKVYFTIPVDYVSGQGVLKRNTCYRISATIKGIAEPTLEVTWSVLDWVTPPVNNVDVGI